MNRVFFLTISATSLCLHPLVGQTGSTVLARQVFVAESSFAASMTQRNLEDFAAFLSPEAVFFADTTAMRGKAAVIEGWRQFFKGPDAPFSWKPEVIEVLSSGTLALSSGPVHDPSGKRVAIFNSIWRRERDGNWRVIFDKGAPVCNCKAGR